MQGIIKKNKGKVFKGQDNGICPPFDFGVDTITQKKWFYQLYTGAKFLSESHIDVLLYQLRKKCVYSSNLGVKFTTTDDLFDQRIQNSYGRFKKKNDLSLVSPYHLVAKYF